MKRFKIGILLLLPLVVSVFLSVGYAQFTDTAIISMSGNDWTLKVDGQLQTAVDSKATPYVSATKAMEKELFLTLNSLEDCKAGQIQFKIETQGLTIYKQLPLDKELNVADYDFVNATVAMRKDVAVISRPENVVNSFACFDDNGRKVLHIYASKLLDASGNSVWVDSDLKDGLLTVYLDQKFLETAKFPVLVDPTFGYTSVGGSSVSSDSGNILAYKFSTTGTGSATITDLNVYLTDGTGYNYRLAVFKNSDNSLVYESNSTAFVSNGWNAITGLSVSITLGEDYYLAFQSSNSLMKVARDNAGTRYYHAHTYGVFDDPLVIDSSDSYTQSIYATYTTDGEPTPTATPSPSPSPSLTPITSGELNNSMLFVLGFMVVMCLIGLLVFVRPPLGLVTVLIGLFTVFVGLYCALGGVYSLGVAQGWFSLFVALFGGLTMLLVGLGVRVRK